MCPEFTIYHLFYCFAGPTSLISFCCSFPGCTPGFSWLPLPLSPQLLSQLRVLTDTTVTLLPNSTSCLSLPKGERWAPAQPLLPHCSGGQSSSHIQANTTGSIATLAPPTTSRLRWGLCSRTCEMSPESDQRDECKTGA